MDRARRDLIGVLLEQALALPPAERAVFLERACGTDVALHDDVGSLLSAFESSSDYLENLAAQVVAPLLGSTIGGVRDDVAIGQTVSHYEIIERIGDGGMGVVYRARDLRLGRSVALKFLPAPLATDVSARTRLLAEARAASALDHPHIGVIHEIGETDAGRLFLAMAWYEGETLRSRLQRGALPVAEALALAEQIAAALAAAHGAGIVHRDVKPSNILITKDGSAKLVDFGIARAAGAELTLEGGTLGTVAYMSPEQTRGETVEQRTDLWSFGVVLYEMLAGQRPFRAERDELLIHAIRHDDPEPLVQLRPDVPAALGRLVDICLAKDPAARNARAADVLAELLAVRSGHDVASYHQTGTRGGSSLPARPRVRMGRTFFAVAAIGAAVAIAVSSYVVRQRSAGPQLDPQRVVVARFENRTDQPSLDAVGSMAADWIIQGLAKTGLVHVVPVSAALTASRFASTESGGGDPAARIRLLAAETGAGFVVSGAYYEQGDSLYIWATATDATRDRLLLALEPVGTPSDQPLGAFEMLRQRLITGLAPHVDPRLRDWTSVRVSSALPDYETYTAFAEGMDLFIARDWRGATIRFGDARTGDSGFMAPLFFSALAFVNLGDFAAVDSILAVARPSMHLLPERERLGFEFVAALARGDLVAAHRAQLRNPQFFPGGLGHWGLANAAMWVNRPRETVRISRQLDPERGELRGWYFYWRDLARAHHRLGQHREELRVARRARSLFPDEPLALVHEVRTLAALRRTRELRGLLADQMQVHPSPAGLLRQAGLELIAHDARDAGAALLRESLEVHLAQPSEAPGFRVFLAEAHMRLGEWDEASALLGDLVAELPNAFQIRGMIGTLAARREDTVEAARISAWLASPEQSGLRGRQTFWRARIAALLGEREDAMRLLRQAFREGLDLWDMLHTEPDFDDLRDYAPFREFGRPKG